MNCHSGGALGSDTLFEIESIKYGIIPKAYSYKTKYHTSPNKVEISEEDYIEGIEKVKIANKKLKRFGYQKYMNLLARNWSQVKYSDEVFAISTINFKNNTVDGGTGWACQMCIDSKKPLFVFDQNLNQWFRWSYITESFIKIDSPTISTNDFTGIGTRELNENGQRAISELFINNFNYGKIN